MQLQQLIEEAKKEFEIFMENPIAFDKGGCLRLDKKALLIFLESKIRQAYKEGAEGMRDAMTAHGGLNELCICSEFDGKGRSTCGFTCPLHIQANEQAESFLASLEKPTNNP